MPMRGDLAGKGAAATPFSGQVCIIKKQSKGSDHGKQ